MEEVLRRRYEALFLAYETGSDPALRSLKARIGAACEGPEPALRPDAALYLLVNFDHMILRPYFGRVSSSDGRPLTEPQGFAVADDRAPDLVARSLEAVLGGLEGPAPHSAHAVALAVEAQWPALSRLYGWA